MTKRMKARAGQIFQTSDGRRYIADNEGVFAIDSEEHARELHNAGCTRLPDLPETPAPVAASVAPAPAGRPAVVPAPAAPAPAAAAPVRTGEAAQ